MLCYVAIVTFSLASGYDIQNRFENNGVIKQTKNWFQKYTYFEQKYSQFTFGMNKCFDWSEMYIISYYLFTPSRFGCIAS